MAVGLSGPARRGEPGGPREAGNATDAADAADVAGSAGAGPGLRRRVARVALVLGVIAVHAWVAQAVVERMADLHAELAMPPRMEVLYVREMALSAPPPTAAPSPLAAPRAPRPRRVKPPRPASAPEPRHEAAAPVVAAASAPAFDAAPDAEATPELGVGAAPEPGAGSAPDGAGDSPTLAPRAPASAAASASASAPAIAALVAAAPASAAASSPIAAFEWPASTRVSYVLTGNYRGEVNGSAQVEWVRAGAHYQVHLDLVVGPSFAPVITRRMTSDGAITAAGLAPRRYDQDTKVVLRAPSRVTIGFEPGAVVLANGTRTASVPGVQDTASQFVQLTYVFSTRPELLRIGGSVEIPLALPNRVGVWTYDVVGEDVLETPFGPLSAIHLVPRRTAQHAGDLSAEIWFAPQLRYLPVRIRIEQDPQTYIDLMISKRPELGAP